MNDKIKDAFEEGYRQGLNKAAEYYDKGHLNGYAKGKVDERQRILAIIEKEPWEVYGDDYYTTYDAEASIAKLKALIEKETPS